MSKRLDETIGSVGFDNLINGVYPPAEVFSVVIRKGAAETTYKRGTVLALSSGAAGDGKYVMLGSTPATVGEEPDTETETLTANCILAEDVTVGTAADELAIAYRTGHFNGNTLIMDEGHTFSAEDKEALRSAGILVSDALEI